MFPRIRVFCDEFGWGGFLVVCFRYKISPNQENNICCGEKGGPNATFNLFFLGLGWPWGWGVRRFHDARSIFSSKYVFEPSILCYVSNTLIVSTEVYT